MDNCIHSDGVYLYAASDEDGNEVTVWRCPDCGSKYVEGGF